MVDGSGLAMLNVRNDEHSAKQKLPISVICSGNSISLRETQWLNTASSKVEMVLGNWMEERCLQLLKNDEYMELIPVKYFNSSNEVIVLPKNWLPRYGLFFASLILTSPSLLVSHLFGAILRRSSSAKWMKSSFFRRDFCAFCNSSKLLLMLSKMACSFSRSMFLALAMLRRFSNCWAAK